MDITKWEDTWGTIDWRNDSENKIVQEITEFYHAGVDFNMLSPFRNPFNKGTRPLNLAAGYSTLKVIDLLIDGGADINLADRNGYTPLHCASWSGKMKKVKYLIEHGPSNKAKFVNRQNSDGSTALHLAASNFRDSLETVQALIEAGANVNTKNNRGETALHLATIHGYTGRVETLIEAGAKMNIKNNDGETALSIAAFYGRTSIVEALIKAGAKVSIKNADGETALDNAEYDVIRDLIKNALLIRTGYVLTHPHTIAKRAMRTLTVGRQYS